MPFKGVDFYRIDDLLSDEERMVRDTVRRFVDERVIPIIDKHFEEATFPSELIPIMAEMGLFGGNLPEEYGCANMNNVAYGLVMQELERGDSGLRSFVSVQGALVMYPIFTFGSEEQKRQVAAAARQRRKDRLLRPDRTGSRLRSRRHGNARAADQTTAGYSTERNAGSQMERSPTLRSSGRRSMRTSKASSSKPTHQDFRLRKSRTSCRCALPSLRI